MKLTILLSVFTVCLLTNGKAWSDKLQKLQEGNNRFVSGQALHPNQNQQRLKETSSKQKPFAAILSCSDSRLSPEIIFDQGIGDLFVVRVAGNTLTEEALGSLEFAVSVLGVDTLVILGHEKCGAVEAALSGQKLDGHLPSLTKPIIPAIKQCPRDGGLDCAVNANVEYVFNQIKKSKPILSKYIQEGKLNIYKGIYHLESGKVEFLK